MKMQTTIDENTGRFSVEAYKDTNEVGNFGYSNFK